MFKHRDIDIQAVAKIIREFPVVPLYQDMAVTLVYILKRAPTLTRQSENSEVMVEEYEGADTVFQSRYALGVDKRWLAFRQRHSQYMVELQLMLTRLGKVSRREKDGTPDVSPRGCGRLLRDCSARLSTPLRSHVVCPQSVRVEVDSHGAAEG